MAEGVERHAVRANAKALVGSTLRPVHVVPVGAPAVDGLQKSGASKGTAPLTSGGRNAAELPRAPSGRCEDLAKAA